MNAQPIRRDAVLHIDSVHADDALRTYALDHGQFAVNPVCALPGLGTEISLVRDVVVTVKPAGGGHGGDGRYTVHWQPADHGRFPRFDGTLRILSDGELTRLQLDGAYDDPVAPRGDVAEVELGLRFSQATARAMLDEIIATVSV
jgi:hypothetical protein